MEKETMEQLRDRLKQLFSISAKQRYAGNRSKRRTCKSGNDH